MACFMHVCQCRGKVIQDFRVNIKMFLAELFHVDFKTPMWFTIHLVIHSNIHMVMVASYIIATAGFWMFDFLTTTSRQGGWSVLRSQQLTFCFLGRNCLIHACPLVLFQDVFIWQFFDWRPVHMLYMPGCVHQSFIHTMWPQFLHGLHHQILGRISGEWLLKLPSIDFYFFIFVL